MRDDMLSQEEIDALLKMGEGDHQTADQTSQNEEGHEQDSLTSIEEDTLGEIGNISFGSSATTLSALLNQKVAITTPDVKLINRKEADNEFKFDHLTIEVQYTEVFSGKNVFVMKKEDAAVISDIMLGGDGTHPEETLGEIHMSALQEAMNQMMGTAATSMSSVFDQRIDISPPTVKMPEPPDEMDMETLPEDDKFVKVSFELQVGNLIDSNIMQLIPIHFAKRLTNVLLNHSHSQSSPGLEESAAAAETQEEVFQSDHTKENQTFESDANPRHIGQHQNSDASVKQAAFTAFEPVSNPSDKQHNLDMLLDVQLDVSVELGKTKRSISDILSLSSGSIIELDKLAGEPVDVLINKKLVAKGEVVVIDENFGVRITDIISQSDRLHQLK